ncbi:MAG: hypothetical protein E7407_05335 [Ruminococcaceae bacterium]|nr:hypothetical protein [Oscillospiraceae bacterium]
MMSFSFRISSFFRINLLFFLVFVASIAGNYYIYFLLSYGCALLHEIAHVLVARGLGIGISYIEVLPFGVCARLKEDVIKNPSHEILVALSGPVLNIILAILVCFLNRFDLITPEYLTYFFFCNCAMACINLVPVLPLDGGRILRGILTYNLGFLRAYNITAKISRIPVFIIFSSAVYLLLTNGFNFSLLLIGVFLVSQLLNDQKNISKHALFEMLHYEEKIKNNTLHSASVITAHKSTPARKILKKLSYHTYYIILVVDDNLNVSKTLTEGQLIRSLTNKGIRISLDEV